MISTAPATRVRHLLPGLGGFNYVTTLSMAHANESFVQRRIGSPSAHPASAVSTSPRLSSLSRPNWPWINHKHGSSSSSSLPSVTANPAAASNANWEAGSSASTNAWSGTARQSAGSVQGSMTHIQTEETIRQWNFTVRAAMRPNLCFIHGRYRPLNGLFEMRML